MSDPVTNAEIEDVLSSIRKLVAEEVRSSPVAKKPEKPGRLILTPALRVKDDEPEAPPASGPVLLTHPVAVERSFDEIPGDARLAEFGEVEGAFPDIDVFEARRSEEDRAEDHAVKEAAPDEEVFDAQAPQNDDAVTDAGDETQTEETWPPQDESWDLVEDESSAQSDLNRMIEDEVAAALGLSDAEAEGGEKDDTRSPDETSWENGSADSHWHEDQNNASEAPEAAHEEGGSGEVDEHDAEEHAELVHDQSQASEESADDHDAQHHAHDDAAWHQQDEDTQSEPVETEPETVAPLPPQTLEDKIAALSRLVAGGNQEFEEERDRADADDLAAASEPMTWPDAAPFEEIEEDPVSPGSNVLHARDVWPQQSAEQSQALQPDRGPSEATASDAVRLSEDDQLPTLELDEEMLRQMVVDIVRQELQGALGERITRNVRKLVRREIHRMLISQDFD
ncbi:hypothetical protein [Marivita sp. XM-24bin2]|jgi:hypothetical protein|uniref:hypothetical protein n=1 Tax=unclassified Marivita TaxID=2632480 RepID=UPI000D78EEC1|nr:hypothetical protein [Marivita sp. XM-24bin2]MCR9111464.1 hypothetical protein [Paracoccaceae bacterium]PWL33838.1 MAG: hypothetical protein DCO97_17550 [Marivita sp. XM-24bin2]